MLWTTCGFETESESLGDSWFVIRGAITVAAQLVLVLLRLRLRLVGRGLDNHRSRLLSCGAGRHHRHPDRTLGEFLVELFVQEITDDEDGHHGHHVKDIERGLGRQVLNSRALNMINDGRGRGHYKEKMFSSGQGAAP